MDSSGEHLVFSRSRRESELTIKEVVVSKIVDLGSGVKFKEFLKNDSLNATLY